MISKIPANLVVVISLVFAGQCFATDQDYAENFKQLQDKKADAQIEPLLNEWRAKTPNDPDAWITSANYYFNQRQVMLSTKKPEKGDFSLRDPKTGKEAGSISFPQEIGSVKRAAELLEEATRKFPDRLDIWCGLAFIEQESGNFDGELSTLKRIVAYAHDHPAQLKWLKGEPLDQPTEKFVPEKLHGYGLFYEKKENADDDERWLQIATLATQQYPNHPAGFNDVAGYYADVGDWQKARESLEKAHQIDPKSVSVLINLGNVSVEQKDLSGARKFYEEALKMEPTGEFAQQVKDALRKLKDK